MRHFKFSLLSAIVLYQATCLATPVTKVSRQSHSLITRNDEPKPSSYPGSGTEFKNEWLYLNFDMKNKDDKANVEIIHNAFDGMRRLVLAAVSSGVEKDDLVPEKDSDGNPNSDVGPLVAKVVIDNKDFFANDPKNKEVACAVEGVQAYTDIDNSKTHFCPLGLKVQDTAKLSCDSDLDPFVSEKMDSTGRIALHEMLHIKFITEPVKNLIIGDAENKDEKGAFGPERAFALIHGTPAPDENKPDEEPEEGSGENPGLAPINCDSYAWHATNAFMARKHCKQKDFEDPKNYEDEEKSDPGSPPTVA